LGDAKNKSVGAQGGNVDDIRYADTLVIVDVMLFMNTISSRRIQHAWHEGDVVRFLPSERPE